MSAANERAARNWFDARNGPSVEHLVMLILHSPVVAEVVLAPSVQFALVSAKLAVNAKDRARQTLVLLDDLTENDPDARSS